MKKIMLSILCIILSLIVGGCSMEEQSSDNKLQQKTEQSMKEMNSQIGMPAIVNFQERKLAKMIFELRDQEDLITYAYIVNHMTGKFIFIGKCIGFGLPYSVQYTNPEKIVTRYGNRPSTSTISGEIKKIPQADPNGLFMPQGLSATWLMMIDPETKEARPVYIEPEIVVSPFPLHEESGK